MRRALAVLIAALLSLALLPSAAFAAVPGVANLTVGQEVFPGGSREFAIAVTNSSTRTLGVVGGTAANSVRIILPSGSGVRNTAVAPTPPAGWAVTVTRTATAQALTYNATGAGLAPGASQTFAFPAEVVAPTADRSGKFAVSLSSDGGGTSQSATGNLTTLIRVLEVVGEIKPTAPAGVVDRTGTAGQAITYAMSVRNYASGALSVTPKLESNGGETISQPAAASVPAGATTAFAVPVKLPEVTSDRVSQFTGSASATGAQSNVVRDNFSVQARPVLSLASNSFSPRAVNTSPTSKTFTMNTNKSGTPALSLSGGSLAFCGNTVPLSTPVAFSSNSANNVGLSWGPQVITGADGTCDALFTFTGRDDNGAAFTQTSTLAQLITIDSLVPNITVNVALPTDRDGAQQTAAKTNDSITVSGVVDGDAQIDFVELRPNTGDAIAVPVTRTGNNYTGKVNAPFAANATSFIAVAQATDAASNVGGGAAAANVIDNVIPKFNFAQTVSLTTISASFEEANLVKGGCDEILWQVENNIVIDVLNDNGGTGSTACTDATNNSRLLVLARPMPDRDTEPRVTYTPSGLSRSNAKDGADNRALEAIVKAVSGIAPPPPDILTVSRNTSGDRAGWETATLDDNRYFTRFGGNDLVVSFGGARSGYSIQVLNGANQVLKTEQVSFPEEGNPEVRVPIGTSQGDYVRKLRLINHNNVVGELAEFTVTLDQTIPTIAGAAKAGETAVNVNFSEKISHGTDFAFDWLPYENVASADGGRQYYNVDKVEGSGASRTLTVTTFENNGDFGGAEYLLITSNGTRYLDRAGNPLADTIANL